MIGDAAGAKGWEMAGYIGGGALIGGLSGGAAVGVSAAGGGAALAGAAAGAVGGAGFNGMATNWDGNAMIRGAAFGAISGFVGGGVGSAIGGGWGALAGGASANLTGQLLYNEGNFNQVNWGSVAGSAALSLGIYHGMSYASYKQTGGEIKFGNNSIKLKNYNQFAKLNRYYQRSKFWNMEYKGKITTAGVVEMTGKGKHGVPFTVSDFQGAKATWHTHWQTKSMNFIGNPPNLQRVLSTSGLPAGTSVYGGSPYHSGQDFSIPGASVVISGYGYSSNLGSNYNTLGSYNDPFSRFFLFPWMW